MTTEQSKRLRKLLALRAASPLGGEACVDWAVEALVDGLDTPNLGILAGLQKPLTWSEVDLHFELALSELGVPIPDYETALRAYLRDLAEGMVSGLIPLFDGWGEIYRISVQLDYPDDLRTWIELDHDLDPDTYSQLEEARLGAAILQEARQLLDSGKRGGTRLRARS